MEKQFMSFKIAEDFYGINILGVREINYSRQFTAVPHAKNHIVGLLNLRGQIVTTLDIGIPLGYDPRDITENTSLLIMKTNSELSPIAHQQSIETTNDNVGLLVDKIGDVITVEESEIHPVPAHVDSDSAKYMEGVLKIDKKLVSILSIPELVKYGTEEEK